MVGGESPFERNLKVVAGAAIFCVVSFLPIIGEKGAADSFNCQQAMHMEAFIYFVLSECTPEGMNPKSIGHSIIVVI